jgi:hypothetical protein
MKIDGLPEGVWIEMRGVDELTGGDQDAWLETCEELFGADEPAEPQVSEENPAVLAEPAPAPARRVRYGQVRQLTDLMLARLVTGWSYPELTLPYRKEYRDHLPLTVCQRLEDEAGKVTARLNGDDDTGPKAESSTTSASTSTDDAPAPQPEPAPAPSNAVSG